MFNYLQIGIGAIAAFALSWALHTLDVGRIEAVHSIEMANQQKALIEQCEKDKQITKEANDGLQQKISVITGKLAAAKRLPSRCVPVTVSSNASSCGGEHAGQDGIGSGWLRDYAADCETYRQERITLEKFIEDERK